MVTNTTRSFYEYPYSLNLRENEKKKKTFRKISSMRDAVLENPGRGTPRTGVLFVPYRD